MTNHLYLSLVMAGLVPAIPISRSTIRAAAIGIAGT
jgi:hypothetical protein